MSTTTAEEKARLRRALGAAERAIPASARRESDRALTGAFLALDRVAAAQRILLFSGMGAEPDTGGLLQTLLAQGKQVALPRCIPHAPGRMEARWVLPGAALVRHPYGMLEPGEECPAAAREELELILVPALAYDREGYRLGRGGGYYDRYLSGYEGFTVGLCRAGLLCRALPREAHDRPVALVVTEDGCIQGPSHPRTGQSGPPGPALPLSNL